VGGPHADGRGERQPVSPEGPPICGDDPVYVAEQLGHTDPNFTLRVYAQAVRHRSKLTPRGKGRIRRG